MGDLRLSSLRVALFAGVSVVAALTPAHASGPILGQTAGSTVSAPPLAAHPLSRDDTDVTTTYGIVALSSSFIINLVAARFPTYNFVYAGAPSGPGSNITPIDESAFNIEVYRP
jgi:hypothetical protein